MKKFLFISSIVLGFFTTTLISSVSVNAEENIKEVEESSITISSNDELVFDGIIDNLVILPDSNQSNTSTRMVNPIRYRKKSVSTYQEWSGYRRVSDNLKTGAKGGSISANKTTTFTTLISGSISGISVNTSGSITNSRGYTLNVGANKRVYLGYRTRYAVETGKREKYDLETGKVYSTDSYTVKRPLYGEYALINY